MNQSDEVWLACLDRAIAAKAAGLNGLDSEHGLANLYYRAMRKELAPKPLVCSLPEVIVHPAPVIGYDSPRVVVEPAPFTVNVEPAPIVNVHAAEH